MTPEKWRILAMRSIAEKKYLAIDRLPLRSINQSPWGDFSSRGGVAVAANLLSQSTENATLSRKVIDVMARRRPNAG